MGFSPAGQPLPDRADPMAYRLHVLRGRCPASGSIPARAAWGTLDTDRQNSHPGGFPTMNDTTRQAPAWRPIRFLPTFLYLFDAQLDEARGIQVKLTTHKMEPHVLDGAMLGRIRHYYARQRKTLPIQDEQFMRWQAEAATAEQREMLARVSVHADELSGLFNSIIAAIDALSRDTLDSSRQNASISAEPRVAASP